MTQESWNGYWNTVTGITVQATAAWIGSYAACIGYFRSLLPKLDYAMLQPVIGAWAACDGSPDLANAWNTEFQNLIKEFHKVERSLAEAIEESSMSYLKHVGAVLSAYGLVDPDALTVRLVMEQIAASDHVAVG